MGACLGRDSLPPVGPAAAAAVHSSHPSLAARRRSRRPSNTFSDSTSTVGSPRVSHAKNRPLRSERLRWKSDLPLTEGQLKSKRDEFWDTAPAFDGKAEVWAALKAAIEATLGPEEDFQLAQAILDGAGVSLPHGSLVECHDELGTREGMMDTKSKVW